MIAERRGREKKKGMNNGDEWGVDGGVVMQPDHLSHEIFDWAEVG